MLHTFLSKLKKHWFLVWALIVAVTLPSIIGFAAYTRLSSVKRVVTTQKGGLRFSSNYLSSESHSIRTIYRSNDTEDVTIEFSLCNYMQGDRAKFYANDIVYTLSAMLTDENGNPVSSDKYTVKDPVEPDDPTPFKLSYTKSGQQTTKVLNNSNQSVENTLEGGNESTHWYTLTVPKSQISASNADKVYVKLEASTDSFNSVRQTLSALLKVALRSKEPDTGWIGYFNETASAPQDLFGFNYVITGSGAGIAVLEWDNRYVCINPSYENIENGSDKYHNKISLSLGAENVSRYNIQFYRNDEPAAAEEWVTDEYGKYVNIKRDGYNYITFTPPST